MATLSLDDAELWYEVAGDGPPLVFLHGGWSDAETWGAQVDHFARNYRVITYDGRGQGRTGATDRRRYSIDLFADDLERLLAHLDVERPVLCGLSLGSMVVQEFLDRHPERASGAVVAGAIRSMPPVDLPYLAKPFVSPIPALGVSLSTMGSEATFRSLLQSIRMTTGAPWLSVDPSVRAEAVETAGEVSTGEFLKLFAAMYRYDPPELSHVETPVLGGYGAREAVLVKRQCERITTMVNEGRSTEIPGAAHLANEDAPGAFNDAVERFLQGLPDARYEAV